MKNLVPSTDRFHRWIQTTCVAIVTIAATTWLLKDVLAYLYAAWLICPPRG